MDFTILSSERIRHHLHGNDRYFHVVRIEFVCWLFDDKEGLDSKVETNQQH